MRKRDSLLGRARPADRLTREQIAALDKQTSTPPAPPAPTKPTAPPATQEPRPTADKPEKPRSKQPAKPTAPKNGPVIHKVRRDQLSFRWSADCPACGFKVVGNGHPTAGQRLARCGRCKIALVLEGG